MFFHYQTTRDLHRIFNTSYDIWKNVISIENQLEYDIKEPLHALIDELYECS